MEERAAEDGARFGKALEDTLNPKLARQVHCRLMTWRVASRHWPINGGRQRSTCPRAEAERHRTKGPVVRSSAPTRIRAEADGRVARLLGVSLADLEAGEYSLALTVRDEVAGADTTAEEAFSVVP